MIDILTSDPPRPPEGGWTPRRHVGQAKLPPELLELVEKIDVLEQMIQHSINVGDANSKSTRAGNRLLVLLSVAFMLFFGDRVLAWARTQAGVTMGARESTATQPAAIQP